MLHQHFVQSGIVDFDHALFFSRLMQERIEDDYSDFIAVSEDEVKEFIEPARRYVEYIEELIKKLSSANAQ